MLHILNSQNTVLNKFVAEIRDKSIQKDSMRFRRNLERIGEVMAYEISKTFEYAVKVVETPLGEASVAMISDQVVIATILRAGLPFHQGFLNYFDDAQNAFVSAYREEYQGRQVYQSRSNTSRVASWRARLLLVYPMLATGSSLVLAYNALCERGGQSAHTHARRLSPANRGSISGEESAQAYDHDLVCCGGRGIDFASLYRAGYRRCGRFGLWQRRSNVRRLLFFGSRFLYDCRLDAVAEAGLSCFSTALGQQRPLSESGSEFSGTDSRSTARWRATSPLFRSSSCWHRFWIPLSQRVWRIVLTVYFSLIALVTAAIFAVDLNLYGYWGFRLDGSVLIYLADPGEALASASWGEVLRQIIIMLLYAGAMIWSYRAVPAFPGETRFPAGPDRPDGCGAADRRLDFLVIRAVTVATANVSKVLLQLERVAQPRCDEPRFFRFSLRSGTMRTMPRPIRFSKRSGGKLFSKSYGVTRGPIPVRPGCCAATGRTSY